MYTIVDCKNTHDRGIKVQLLYFQSGFLLLHLGKQQIMSNCHHVSETDGIPGSRLGCGPAPATEATEGVNQHAGTLLSLCLSIKSKNRELNCSHGTSLPLHHHLAFDTWVRHKKPQIGGCKWQQDRTSENIHADAGTAVPPVFCRGTNPIPAAPFLELLHFWTSSHPIMLCKSSKK